MCELNRIHHWCSVGTENPNPRAHRYSGKRGLPSFPLNGGPDSILFLIYHDRTVQYCVSVGDVTEVDVYSVQINLKQRINSALNNEQMVISS